MEKIVEIGINRLTEAKREFIEFAFNKETDTLLNDIENNPHVFVLACLMDRQIKAEKAWAIPQKVFDKLETHDIKELVKIPPKTFETIFQDNRLHRFNSEMGGIFYSGIQDITSKYGGNAAKIWQEKPGSATVVYRFLEFRGCGIKIATMAANILARRFKIEFADYYSIDISPDVHIKRVMARMGFVPKDSTPEQVIYKARELNPEFPGVIDFSCWEIGKKWCHATNPDCKNCIVNRECRKANILIRQ